MRFTSQSPVVSRENGSPAGRLGGATRASRSSRSRIRTALAAALLSVAACEPYVEGNGVYREEDRTASVGSFTGIHVEDRIVGTVTSHAADFKVVVSGDSNVLQYIRTEVREDTVLGFATPQRVLHVWMALSAGYSSTNPSAVVVQVPDLVCALAEKGARVDASGAAAPVFTAWAEGAGSVSVVGPHATDPAGDPAGDIVYVHASNGNVDAHRYVTTDPTQAASVELSASARVQVHADGPVVGTASGAATLHNAGSGSCSGVTVSGGATADCPP